MSTSNQSHITASASATTHRPAIYVKEHADMQGPGDARPTALQIVKDEQLLGNKLSGKVVLITGCSSGIGVETARAIHATGAAARDLAKTQKVVDDIRKSNPDSKGKLEIVKIELDKLSSVREGAADFLKRSGGKLNILINNAGVMACPYSKTVDGFETQFAVCHLAHFLLFELMKGALLSSATSEFPSRVVNLSSAGHRFGTVNLDDPNFENHKYEEWAAYGQAKTSNIWMATEIERRYGARNLHATAVHPGGIRTELMRHLSEETIAGWNQNTTFNKLFKSPEQGSSTTLWAAVSKEWAHKGGRFLEDCSEAGHDQGKHPFEGLNGHATHAYDQEGAKRLWDLSLKFVGLPADQASSKQ